MTTSGDFTLSAAPAAGRAIAGDQAAVSLTAVGSGTFTSQVTLGVSGAPAGITARLSQPVLAPGGSASLTLSVAGTGAPGTYGVTITGQAPVDGGTLTRTTAVSLDVLAANTPAVTGRVMTAEAVPLPIPGVTITLGAAFTLTDAGGNFVLLAPPPGANMLLVDGRTASTQTAQYPPVEVNVAVNPTGPTRVPFIIYLPKLDTANAITLPTDPAGTVTQTFLATTPAIPGLTITIPAGTRIIGPDGNPVTQLIVTPVPVDRSPMPYPPGVTVPLLFSIQPGGAVPSQPLPITFPNLQHAAAGARATLYFFDLIAGTWATWGTGTVSADQAGVVSNPGFGLPRFAWHFPDLVGAGGDGGSDDSAGSHPQAGEPVDVATGRFDMTQTDLVIPGRLPIAVTRTYRGQNQGAPFGIFGSFGIASNLEPYDAILVQVGSTVTLLRADLRQYVFTPSGVNRWTNGSAPFLAGSVLTTDQFGLIFNLRFKDGTIHRFQGSFLTAIIDRNGNTVTITRASINTTPRIVQLTEPGGRSLRFTRDSQGRIIVASDPLGRVVQYGYDDLGRLITVIDPTGGVTRYTYDASHRIVSATDPRGTTYLTNEYDANGRVIRQTQADGGVWQFAYTLSGAIVTDTMSTDPRGNATAYRFDGRGFTLSQTDALGQTTAYDYAPGPSFRTAVTDPLGRVTRLAYDAVGNVTSVTRLAGTPMAVVGTFTYEPVFNRLSSISDALGHRTSFTYDSRGNRISTTDALGRVSRFAFDSAGQRVSITDPSNAVTQLTYSSGDLVAIRNALGSTSTLLTDAVGRTISTTDELGNVTRRAYDALDRLTRILDPVGGMTTVAHDLNGNRTSVTDARGNMTTYAYDIVNRLTARTDPMQRAERYDYDNLGNLIRATDRKGQGTSYTYDALGRRVSAAYADGSMVQYTYDAGNRLISVADSLSGTIALSYDGLDRLLRESTPRGTVTYTYDAAGRRTSMTVSGQTSVFYEYDAANRLTRTTQNGSAVDMSYDASGRRTNLRFPSGVVVASSYDQQSQVTGITYSKGPTTLGTLGYTYDATGVRTTASGTWARTGLPQAVNAASYDGGNQQLSFGTRLLSYDANGSLVSDGTNTYVWDTRNRLAAVSGPALSASFQYDAVGRRSQKTINGVTTEFIYDEHNIVQEVASAGAAANVLSTLGVDEYILRTDSTGTRTLLSDALGSVVALADGSGTVQTQYAYEPFGATSEMGAPGGNSIQYTARENDGTGLYYYRARYYSPLFGRFISQDPLEIEGGDANLYAYVGNAPLDHTDPAGLCRSVPGESIGKDPTIVCNGSGSFRIEAGPSQFRSPEEYRCRKGCTDIHEQSHVDDFVNSAEYRNICKGQANGTPIDCPSKDGRRFLRRSECKAYQAEAKCHSGQLQGPLSEQCLDTSCRSIVDRARRNAEWQIGGYCGSR